MCFWFHLSCDWALISTFTRFLADNGGRGGGHGIQVIDCGTECIVPGSNHRHDGTTVVDLDEDLPAPAMGEKPAGVKELFMPALSSTMTEGKVVQWLKKEGDAVVVGEPVMVVESDKADMDVESFEEGILAHVCLPEGGSIGVGEPVGFLAPSLGEVEAVKRWAKRSNSAKAPVKVESLAPAAKEVKAPVPEPAAVQVSFRKF